MPKRVLIVFGTRPEAIKMSPLVIKMKQHPELFDTVVCVSGQHREMLHQVLDIFEIKPDYDLDIMKEGQDLYDVTSRVLLGMRDVISEVKPDIVVVHGDTTTSTAAALAAFYARVPVAHVEAGLRTNDMFNPWPEEINRQITSRIARYDFAPTALSRDNLLKENVSADNIFVTGNTVIDALFMGIDKIKGSEKVREDVEMQLTEAGLNVSKCKERKMVLITGHRRENFGEGFINICNAINDLCRNNPDVDFVYPVHFNPNVRNAVRSVFGNADIRPSNLYLIKPLGYLPFIYLMHLSDIVLTDSGGIQEEAPSLGKPVLVMRSTTERPEALDAGVIKLVSTDRNKIVSEVETLLRDKAAYDAMSRSINPYGDGNACGRIMNILK